MEPLVCEAMTAAGPPWRLPGTYVVAVPAAGSRRLCGQHARMAREGPMALRDRPLDTADQDHFGGRVNLRWSDVDDAWLLAHADLTVGEAAALIGRPPASIYQRWKRLEREGMG